jgi:EmrB/QacA subfamily drug resistance transporter
MQLDQRGARAAAGTTETSAKQLAWLALALTCAASFVSTLDLSIVIVAFDDMQSSFHVSTAALSWVITSYTIVAAAMLVPSGRLTDRIGARTTFVAGIGLFALGSMLAGLAFAAWFLIAARVAQAIGSALMAPSSLAIISEYYRHNRATAVGIWGATSGLGGALGPSVGAVIVATLGWRWVFLVNVPIGIAVVVAALRWFRHVPGRDLGQRPDVAGSLLIVGGVSCFALGLVQSEDWGWGARSLGALVLGAALLGLLLWRCTRQASPVIDLRLFRIPSFRDANVIAFVFPVAFFVQFFGLVQFFRGVWGDSALRAGLRITPTSAVAAVFTLFAGRIADRYGHRAAMVPGTLVYAAGALWLVVFLGAEHDPWRAWAPAAVMLGIGVGLTYASFNSAAVHALPADRYGAGSAMNLTINRVGGTIGVAVAVALLGTAPDASSYKALWFVMFAGGLVSGVWSARLHTRPRPVA